MPDPIQFVRQQLGLSQDDMARFLSVSRGVLTKHETHRQPIAPAKSSSLRLAFAQQVFWNLPEVVLPEAPLPPAEVEKEIAKLEAALRIREAEHQKLRSTYEKAVRRIAFVEEWMKRPEEEIRRIRPVLATWKIRAEEELETATPEQIKLLAAKAESLRQQVLFWRNLLP